MLRRLALLLALLALALAAAPASAQEDGEPVPTATPPGCARGPGTDADYAYCVDYCVPGADNEYQDDADYQYCVESASAPPPRPRRRATPVVRPLAAQAGTLPLTGTDPRFIAVCGLGLLLAGAGLRLLRPASPRP